MCDVFLRLLEKKGMIVGMVWYDFSDSSVRHLPLLRYSVLLLPSVWRTHSVSVWFRNQLLEWSLGFGRNKDPRLSLEERFWGADDPFRGSTAWLPVTGAATPLMARNHQQDREVCPYLCLRCAQTQRARQGPSTRAISYRWYLILWLCCSHIQIA